MDSDALVDGTQIIPQDIRDIVDIIRSVKLNEFGFPVRGPMSRAAAEHFRKGTGVLKNSSRLYKAFSGDTRLFTEREWKYTRSTGKGEDA